MMHILGSLPGSATAAIIIVAAIIAVALIRRAVRAYRQRRLEPTVIYDLKQGRWVQARSRRLSLTRRSHVGKELS